jgi:hypothetical protein
LVVVDKASVAENYQKVSTDAGKNERVDSQIFVTLSNVKTFSPRLLASGFVMV